LIFQKSPSPILSLFLFSLSSNNAMNTLMLAARSQSDRKAESHTCPIENTQGPEIRYFVGELTFHRFATMLAGGCAILSTLIVGILIGFHAFNYSNPVQQRQIIRIVALIPWVAIFSFVIVWQDGIGEYLDSSLDFGCAMALSSFLLFMCDLVLSHPEGFQSLFGEDASAKGELKAQSPIWLRVRSIFCFSRLDGLLLILNSEHGTAYSSSFLSALFFGLQLPSL
jgi:hypothetical protein